MPLAIDLYCGLGGWTEGLLAEGYDVIGFDIEQHCYQERDLPEAEATKQPNAALKLGTGRPKGAGFNVANETAHRRASLTGCWVKYPGQLVIQDVCTLHGSQFRNVDLIVASPPCQEYSYMAMPWKLAKAKAAAIRADTTGNELERLNRLFNQCFRIQKEASFAAGRHIPMVVENVRGAQPWVGRARWNFGSFYLWGDVPALMPSIASSTDPTKIEDGRKIGGGANVPGIGWTGFADTGASWRNREVAAIGLAGIKQRGSGREWFAGDGKISRLTSSKSPVRKQASAMIAKIPLPLSRHIAATFYP